MTSNNCIFYRFCFSLTLRVPVSWVRQDSGFQAGPVSLHTCYHPPVMAGGGYHPRASHRDGSSSRGSGGIIPLTSKTTTWPLLSMRYWPNQVTWPNSILMRYWPNQVTRPNSILVRGETYSTSPRRNCKSSANSVVTRRDGAQEGCSRLYLTSPC